MRDRQVFESLLMPVLRYVRDNMIKSALLSGFEYGSIITFLLTIVLYVISLIANIHMHLIYTLISFVVIYCIAVICLILKKLKGCNLIIAARLADKASNTNNIIEYAYEMLRKKRNTSFAQIAIESGFDYMDSFKVERIDVETRRVKRSSYCFLAGAFLICFMPVVSQGNSAIAVSSDSYQSASEIITKESSVNKEKKDSIDKSGFVKPFANVTGRQYSAAGSFDGISEKTGSLNKASSSSQQSGSDQSNKQSRGEQKRRDSAKDEALNDVDSSRAGSGKTPDTETAVNSKILKSSEPLDDDHSGPRAEDKQKKASSSSLTNQPFLDDQAPAPGRELGRSGKNGKPGNGRGGVGQGKKSRATASILSGQKIKTFIKSRQGNGRTKSFTLEGPTGKDDFDYGLTSLETAAREGLVIKQQLQEDNKIIIKKYFEELNSYANDIFRTGQR